MKVLLLQSSSYIPSLGGANKANRLLLEQLAAQGHTCHAIGTAGTDGAGAFRQAGVAVEAVADAAQLRTYAAGRLRELAPDRVLVSSEDPAQMLLEEAVAASPSVVYLAHTTLHLPFGPDGFLQSPGRTALLRRTAGIVAVSGYIRDYIRRWAGLESTLLRFPVYGEGPHPELGSFDRGCVTLINPCAVKGISIFLELARRMPETAFAAVPTWGTTTEDRAALAALPNVRLLPPSGSIDEIYAQTRVLLAPSLWGEAFGQVAVEAMLRGIPVLASDVGGLPEAKLGVDYVLPVQKIERYEERFDERRIPVAVVPPQDVGPWQEALSGLLADRALYARISGESRQAARAFVTGLGIEPFVRYLEGLEGLEGLPARGAARRMKILLVQPLAYLFPHGGAHKANRLLVRGLAARGHACTVVATATDAAGVFLDEGVEVHAVAGGLDLCAETGRRIREGDPDWTIVSEDPTGQVLKVALEASPTRVVYLSHSPATLPFGPASFAADPVMTALLRRTAGILTVSRAMQDYIHRWAGLASTVVRSPAYGDGPFPAFGTFDRGYVAMINPSGLKGGSIFAALARRMPEVAFAAVPTWSTTAADGDLLAGLPNVTLLPAVDDLDDLYRHVRLLLVPSLWGEAFGQVVIEALLRGIPVITSDQGGLPEAGLGVTRIVPVRPIERYEDRLDDRRMPIPVVPDQDLAPWEAELRTLLGDRAAYERISRASRRAAADFVAGLGIEPYERFLAGLLPAADVPPPPPAAASRDQQLAGLSAEKLELLARRLRKKTAAAPAALTIPRVARPAAGGAFPLSFTQLRMWFLHQLAPDEPFYNESLGVALRGRLHPAALAAGVREIVRRHEALRTRFEATDGEPVQIVSPPSDEAAGPLPLIDLCRLPGALRHREAERLAREEKRRPFDLSVGPLLRVVLVALAAEEHHLLITVHHITADVWAVGVLLRELSALYGAFRMGRPSPLPEVPVQIADFAVWQRQQLEGERLEGLLTWWRERLAGMAPVLELPGDRPRPALPSHRGGLLPLGVPAPLVGALQELARRSEATLFMALLAGFQAFLHRATGQDDVAVGSPIANRGRRELEGLIGCFINTLVLRGDLAGRPTGRELMARTRSAALGAFAHQDLPFELLVERLQPERSLSHGPLFQVMLLLQNVPESELELADLAVTPLPWIEGRAKLDLLLPLGQAANGALQGRLEYSRDLFDPPTAARLADHLLCLLQEMAADPERRIDELPLLSPAERHQVAVEWNDTAAELGADRLGLHQLFERQVRRTPGAPAATFEGTTWTYAELDARAQRLAGALGALGCGPETRVGVAMERSLALVAALLGVLKAGAAYVPLDPEYPFNRLAFMLEDARPAVLITQAHLLPTLPPAPGPVLLADAAAEPEGLPDAAPRALLHDLQLAYVLYTSGSTGRPKGSMVPHGAIRNRLLWMREAYGLGPADTVLQKTPFSFDVSVWEFFAPLLTGARLVLARPGEHRDPAALVERIRRDRVTVLHFVPSMLQAFLDEPDLAGCASLRLVVASGEALPPELVRRFHRRLPAVDLENLYGPTETAVEVTFEACGSRRTGAARRSPPIGRPVANTGIHLLGGGGEPAPIGVAGELCIGGVQVGRGYLGRPDLTAASFVPDPFGAPGSRLYRSGDLARRNPDGTIEFLGRIDHQVKIRGVRIELGEIEAGLTAQPAVREALVMAREVRGEKRLVAYVTAAGEEAGVDTDGLRDALLALLPEPMVPQDFVVLAAFPLTPSGKVDRQALPAPDPAAQRSASAAPRTPVEEMIAGLWAEVLGVERVGLHDSFFDLGGHSLLATRVVSRLRRLLGVELPVRALFERPTVAALAAAVEGSAKVPAPPLAARPRGARAPLSLAQERLWFLDRLEPGHGAYNMPSVLRLRGPVSAPALAAALAALAERHEILRTRFVESAGQPLQEIAAAARLRLATVDLRGLPAAARPAEAALQTLVEARQPFDLTAAPLCRAALLRLEEQEHLLLIDLHHVICDGGSTEIFLRELGLLYRHALGGEAPALPRLPVQYADFALWQRAWLDGGALAPQLDFWRRHLAGAPTAVDLPADRLRPAVPSYRGGAEPVTWQAERVHPLRALGRRQGATLFMTVLAGWASLLHRWSGAPEVIVGAPVANRRQPELEGLIGLFVNTLPLRVDLGGEPRFTDLLDRVRTIALAAYEHQDVPFERLVEAVESGRDLSRSPLFQVLLALQEGAPAPLQLPAVTVEPVPFHNATAKLDLLLALTGDGDRLCGGLEFNADLFEAATARRLADQLARLLAGAAADPELRIGDLPLLDPAEERQILLGWNATDAPFPHDRGLHELFEAQAARTPQAIAVIHGGHRVSYGALDAWAERLAGRLHALGVGPEDLVGVFCSRAPGMVAAVLAVLKAGGAYLPLDPAYPADRLRFLLADSGASLVLTEATVAAALPAFAGTPVPVDGSWEAQAAGAGRPRGFLHPDQMAYAIYTSGSTGTPKGVMIRHGGAVARITWALSAYAPEALAGVLAATSLCFDLSVFEIFAPLAAGGAVVLADDALALPALPAACAVTLVNTVPSALAELLRLEALPPSVRVVNLAGEPLRRELAARIGSREGIEEVHNLYGPSEDTTYSTGARAAPGDPREPAIGRPLPNTRAYLLDAGLRPVPVGVPGELWLAGAGTARGYLRRPDLTADRFRPDPFGPPGGRLYRTGDLGRQRADGLLDYLGRLDRQVKIRGFRIEPGEIEAELASRPGVREAAVVARESATGGLRLVAYVAGDATEDELRRALRERLPDHMVPALFVRLPRLPLTPNGKVDRKALPAPGGEPAPESGEPRTPVEELLAGIWAEVLGVERVGIHQSFFALGGHSLLATRVVARLRSTLGVELPLRTLFERPTVAELAAAVEQVHGKGASGAAPPLAPVPREGPLPLSFAQERLWFIDRLTPGQALYNIPVALRITGPLDPGAPAAALQAVVARHEALRTVFAEEAGAPVQVILPAAPCELPVVDLTGLPSDLRTRQVDTLIRGEAGRPFDLRTGPLLRAGLLRVAAQEHLLLLTLHHIASDGWSMSLLVDEVAALSAAFAAGRPSPLPQPAVQYGDFAAWQRSWLQGPVLEEELAFWRRQLAGLPPLLELPTDRPRPATRGLRGAARPVRLPAALTRRAHALGRQEGATLFMVLLAGFQTLLARTSGQEDLAVGAPVAGRNRVEIEGLIGFFVNTLVLRAGLPGESTFRALLHRVRETALAAYRHQEVPFERLVQELAPSRSLAYTPLFQVMLALQNAPARPPALPGLTVDLLPVETGAAKFDLLLALSETEGTLAGTLEYDAGLFDATTIERFLGHLERLAEAATEDPELPLAALPLLSPAERHQLLVEGRAHAAGGDRATGLHRLFEEQVDKRPEAAAVVYRGRSMTYRDLDREANRLAHLLIARGVGPEVRVGLCLERSLQMVVGILAVLKAGGAYVPLDPALPAERLLFQLQDAGVAALVTQTAGRARVPSWAGPLLCLDDASGALDGWPETAPTGAAAAGGDRLAYVLYTSGSTGRPKGVAVTHANVMRLLAVTGEPFGFGAEDTWTLFHSYAFDFSVWELWGALAHGGRVVVVPQDVARSPEDFFRLLCAERVTVLNQTPSAFRQLAPVWDAGAETGAVPPVRWIVFGGEALEMQSLGAWLARRGPLPRLVNMYGITETTVHVTLRPVRLADTAGPPRSRIGGPLADLELYVADRGLSPQPFGVPGELCVGGEGLARGYWRRPELTAERFVPDPWSGRPGARLYRSGDLGRRLPDGDVEYLGRIDHQVKIRGQRIELGEIEAALALHPAVRASVVQAVEGPTADRRLAAWVAVAPGPPPGTAELRAFLAERLTDAMIPASFVLLDALPLTANGKVDRAALPAPEGLRPELAVSFVAPRTPEERAVAAVWQEVLGVEKVGVYDNFFDLGGHSLLMVQVQSRLCAAFARDVPVLDLFQHPTVGALARHLSQGGGEAGEPVSVGAAESRGENRRGRAGDQQLQRQRRRTARTGDPE